MTEPFAGPERPPGDYLPKTPGAPDRDRWPRPTPRPPTGEVPGTTPPPLDEEQNNAYMVLSAMLEEWGLGSLAPEVLRMLQEGYTQTQIPILLQDTDAYKQRFAGNEARRKAGLSVLSPAEYLQTERSYRQIMSQAGLPPGFYDNPEDFAGFIGNDVAPTEVQRRVDEATDAAYRMDDNTARQFEDLFGIRRGDLTAWILDQDRGRDELNRIVRGARIAGAAAGQGLQLSREQAERYGLMATGEYMQEAQRFGALAGLGERLSGIYGPSYAYGVEQAAEETFQGSAAAEERRRRLQAREAAEFAGYGGAGPEALAEAGGGY